MTDPKDRAQSVFLNALEISSERVREAYLDAECNQNVALREEVDGLLEHAPRVGRFLETDSRPATPQDATAELAATQEGKARIGSYRLREKIGEGGMGEVYLAEQTKPVRRKVALKIIKPGMATKEVVARFEAERQALAMMDHPNIANVLDGGATETGRPFFVMELVRGTPITEYCDQRQLSMRDRLALFLRVCGAVQHAHQKGIIHRDLKPSNVLVTEIDGQAVPKVIDFGVAKAVNQKLTHETLHTQFAQVVGTPLYMSPEQAGSGVVDIDTRADVYSLGVLLYELLTGATPFDRETLEKSGFDEFRRILREQEPRRPSDGVSTLKADQLGTLAQRRNVDAGSLVRTLRGELDWIVMKALEKDRNRRYESASALSSDIQRHLNDEPVSACPPSAIYQLSKFARRNRAVLAVSAVLVIIVALCLAGLGVSNVLIAEERNAALIAQQKENDQRLEAERQRRLAEKNAESAQQERDEAEKNLRLANRNLALARSNFTFALETVDQMYLNVAQHWVTDDIASSEVQVEFLHRAAEFYQRVLEDTTTYELSLEKIATCRDRLGRVYAEVGDTRKACEESSQAVELFQRCVQDNPTSVSLLLSAADSHSFLAQLHEEVSDYVAAEAAYRTTRSYFQEAADLAEGLDKRTAEFGQARIDVDLAQLLVKQNRLAQARQSVSAARDVYRRGGPEKVADVNLQNGSLGALAFLWETTIWSLLEHSGEFENFLRCEWLSTRMDRLEGRDVDLEEQIETWLGQIRRVKSGSPSRGVLQLELLLLEEKALLLIDSDKYESAIPVLRDVLAKRVRLLRAKQPPLELVPGFGGLSHDRPREFVQPEAFHDYALTELRLAKCLRRVGLCDQALVLSANCYWYLFHLEIVMADRLDLRVASLNALAEVALAIEQRWPEKSGVAAQQAGQAWYRQHKKRPDLAKYVSGLHEATPDLKWFLDAFPQYDFLKGGEEAVGRKPVALPLFDRNTRVVLYARSVRAFRERNADETLRNTTGYGGVAGDFRNLMEYGGGDDAFICLYMAMVSAKHGKMEQAQGAYDKAIAIIAECELPSEELKDLLKEAEQVLGQSGASNEAAKESKR